MKVKCIKSIVYHWGVQFEEDKYYNIIDQSEREQTIIADSRYWDDSRTLASSGRVIQKFKNITEQEIDLLVPGYLTALKNYRTGVYTKKVSLPFVTINSEGNSTYSFCSMNEDEISKKFNIPIIDEKIKFSTTVYLFDEYFKTIQELRQEKLGSLKIF